MKISEQELKSIKGLQTKQDQNAYVIGIATIEYWENVVTMVAKVQRTKQEQLELGKAVLKAHGVDPDKVDYTIDTNDGSIKQLVVKDGVAQYEDIIEKEGVV